MSNSALKIVSILAVSTLVVTLPTPLFDSQDTQKLEQHFEISIEVSIEQMNKKVDHQIELKLNK
ncbi:MULTISPECIES: hypothetical protein [unclassified Pseudoalteromonas]|uniref:hypothetical protein n=1 Tax=unclassified Pseudoalteromonas TaxID=194690 RepID=UPI0006CA2056|nr:MULTISPECIES: hypothetical protein [unclassified Pseudoalteromonas]KPM75807.1 hypothetical protein AOG26_15525 [Pseudoalteromonas sp. UCD-33C]KPZ71861.1 hypothetical protein AN394_01944 [Pseudoalteromonas sp. P1-26]